MKRTRVTACAVIVAASLAGCMGTGDVEYAGEVRVTSPELVSIGPGVQVVSDADEPLFYASNDYWLYRDGYWFRSNDYRRGFARVDFVHVPQELRAIERPHMYVQYRRNMAHQHHARPSPVQRRSQQPTHAPSRDTSSDMTPPVSPTIPARPMPPVAPHDPYAPQPGHHPHPGQQPSGANPTQPTPPPDASSPPTTPSDSRRDRTAPIAPQTNTPPDQERAPRSPPGPVTPE